MTVVGPTAAYCDRQFPTRSAHSYQLHDWRFHSSLNHGPCKSERVEYGYRVVVLHLRISAFLTRLVLYRFAALLDVLACARHGIATGNRAKEANKEDCRQ